MIKFITGNKGKLKEAQQILAGIEGLDIDLNEIQEIDPHKIIEAKLEEARKVQSGEFIVEDTSLYFDALNGLPGPLIKWFLKTIGNDGLWELIKPYQSHKGRAVTLIGYSNKNGDVLFFEGAVSGKITQPRGDGFGWDPIFTPNGHNKTFGEMNELEKNSISMRKLAFEKLKDYLNEEF